MSSTTCEYDVIIIGGGHNGLVAASLLASADRRVLVLEQLDHVGGAAVSESPFPGVAARISSYSYLVSLFPRQLLERLGVNVELRRRRIASYPPNSAPAVEALCQRAAAAIAPTLTEPLRSRQQLRELVDDDEAWDSLIERPLSELLERVIGDDLTRGIVATDALIGTFAALDDPQLKQNRCFLYHVIGNGTGSWDIPVGGMGALTDGLEQAALRAGVEILTGAQVTAISAGPLPRTDPCSVETGASAGAPVEVQTIDGRTFTASQLLSNVAPTLLARLLGDPAPGPAPEGSQLKLNMVLTRLPALRGGSDPRDAFAGTFHINEGYSQLAQAYRQAAGGQIPSVVPAEAYCHSLTDPSILSPELAQAGAQTLTVFALHMPARLFTDPAAKQRAVDATMGSINSVLAQPIQQCLMRDRNGQPCLEVRSPPELEAQLGLPGGHIFHRSLHWPFTDDPQEVGTWGVETLRSNVWLCGAGARRGGGVSGIPGHNAAAAVLAAT